MFAAFLCTILFSLSAVSGHRSARRIGGTEANFWRVTVAALFLGLWAFSFGTGLQGGALPLFLLSGVAGIGVGDVAFFQALPRLGARRTSLLAQCLTPPSAALLEYLWLGTKLTPTQIACGAVILAGVALAVAPTDRSENTRRELTVGTVFCALSAFGVALGAVLSRKAYEVTHTFHQPIDPGTAGLQRVLGGLMLAGFWLLVAKQQVLKLQKQAPPELVAETARQKWRAVWFWVLLNGLAGQTIGVTCMQWALETTPTGLVLAIISTTPIMLIPVAFLFEGEVPTRRAVVGGVIAVGGTIALTLAK
jgi:drug/metabolite transporter (DMT)-like permease